LRFCTKLLSPDSLREALGSFVAGTEMDRIAVDWLSAGGNRLRPFVTLGAYAAVAHGRHSFATEEEAAEAMPEPVCKIGLAIEAFHKASLAHDDIEDDDAYRYGSETLHRRYGIGPALNVGDHLIGLGYGLIAAQREHFGADAVADMVARISSAHLQLCRGQGAELLSDPSRVTPSEVLENYALKTSPAFFAALYCGLRAARADVDEAALRAFCTYLGEGYQIQNDLDDWEQNGANKVERGTDAAAGRPTILRALAGGAVGDDVRKVYEQVGAFEKAEALLARVRERAIDAAGSVMPIPLAEFLASLTRMVLRQRIR
jgi:geranylgeranyl pyrophosphate synthase